MRVPSDNLSRIEVDGNASSKISPMLGDGAVLRGVRATVGSGSGVALLLPKVRPTP